MTNIYTFSRGDSPLLVSIPHDGRTLMPGQARDMTEVGKSIPDTDWHVRRLYDFARNLGASVIGAQYSRYVVDLNRPADDKVLYEDQLSTGLFPLQTFDGQAIYLDGFEMTERGRTHRVRRYWTPYHEKIRRTLDTIRDDVGYALLWDAHSIRSIVPTLFEGTLPDLNVGTNDGASCDVRQYEEIMSVAAASEYSVVQDDRFKGGYITRHYGDPTANIHAVQLEISQAIYMDEGNREYDEFRSSRLQETLGEMLDGMMRAAASHLN